MLSFPIGPIVGGYLLDHFWWGSVFLINVPIVVLALIAVVTLLPESRSAVRPRIDLSGMAVSSIGLVALTFGFIKAGQDGWSDAAALGLIAAGVIVLALLPLVERGVTRRGGQPLADLRLFSSPGFLWGTILATAVSFAMFGLFFALPQYFQDVKGADALGSGLRLLPMVGGMLVGMVAGTRLQAARSGARTAVAGPRTVVAAGYLLMATAMVIGAFTTLGSSVGYALAWVALAGLGLGLVMPAAMGTALGALSAERSGAGSALLTAMRQVGSTIGVAVLGTVISNSYSGGVASAAAGLPAQAAAAVRSSVGAGVAAARTLGSSSLLATVRTSFVHGMDIMLWTCGGIAVGCAILALLFLPRRTQAGEAGLGDTGADPDSLPIA
jgi:MFS transporter, DHA2 family, multidrug resistance protein